MVDRADFYDDKTVGHRAALESVHHSEPAAVAVEPDSESILEIDLRSDNVVVFTRHREAGGESGRWIDRDSGLLAASRRSVAVKRAIDIVGGVLLLIFLLPLFATVAALIKVTSKGPVLYISDRVGKDGEVFRFLKFRSMYVGSDVIKEQLRHLNEASGPVFKMREDPRTTPIGRWIRRYSIDELPQLWNVVRGDMSLVGPRPPTCDEVESYLPYQRQRLLVRPGLTCFWQVRGRSRIGFERWVDLDLDYIEQWNLIVDAKILVATIPAVARRDGAY